MPFRSTRVSTALLLTAILLVGPNQSVRTLAHEDYGHFSAGEPGNPKKPARVVKVVMREDGNRMIFEPNRIEVRRGEQIRFVLDNDGLKNHEFVLATLVENRKHAEL